MCIPKLVLVFKALEKSAFMKLFCYDDDDDEVEVNEQATNGGKADFPRHSICFVCSGHAPVVDVI